MTENRKQLCLALLVGMLLGGGFISLLESYEDYRREQFIRREIAENPTAALPQVMLAKLQFQRGHYEMGLMTLQRAIELEPENLDPYFSILDFYIDIKQDYITCRQYLNTARQIAERNREKRPEEYYLVKRYEEIVSMLLKERSSMVAEAKAEMRSDGI